MDSNMSEQSDAPGARQATTEDIGCSEHDRFELELEFVQCLGNPEYLNWLAQTQYFEDAAFIKYLAYLMYWKEPAYCQYVLMPHCLYMLERLQDEGFRRALRNKSTTQAMTWQQHYFYMHYRKNRLRDARARQIEGDEDPAGKSMDGAAPSDMAAGLAHVPADVPHAVEQACGQTLSAECVCYRSFS
eukprot:TRINITY_DN8411_c0_g1_i2.p2 TRINITY_DN8411_c0_g1~~TRINITY_DN8411_c0_g1_i2.p2  ORF type:complete len:187 (-),score=22.20 TRINITY_DN8411_c0_g1_i2:743-1303(-)